MSKTDIQVGGIENDWRNLLLTELKRTGGDPSILFEILESIVKERSWETLLDEQGKPVGSLRRLIEASPPVGCGQKPEKILRLLDLEHRYEADNKQWHLRMTQLRNAVRQEFVKENQIFDEEYDYTLSSLKDEYSEAFCKAYIKENDEKIHAEIESGKLTIYQGMQKYLKRNKEVEAFRRTIHITDAKIAHRSLTKFMPKSKLDELITLLIQNNEQD